MPCGAKEPMTTSYFPRFCSQTLERFVGSRLTATVEAVVNNRAARATHLVGVEMVRDRIWRLFLDAETSPVIAPSPALEKKSDRSNDDFWPTGYVFFPFVFGAS